jgi:hypothetical protein
MLTPRIRPTTCGISSLTSHEGPAEFLAGSYDGQVYRIVPPRASRA